MSHDLTICPTATQLLDMYPAFAVSPYTTGFRAWTLTVVSSAAGLYLAVVDALPFPLTATGAESVTSLRNSMLGLMGGLVHATWLEASSGSDAIVVTSLVDGRGLLFASNLGPTATEMTLVKSTSLTPGDIVEQSLEAADCLVNKWGRYTYDACMAAAVHLMKMWGQGQVTTPGPTGQIASMTQGPFSVSFATSQMTNATDNWWNSTPEGAKFLFYRMQHGPTPVRLRGGASCFPSGRTRRSGIHAGHRDGWL